MFSAGVNIKSQDALKKVTLEYIYNSIKNPKPDFSYNYTKVLFKLCEKCYDAGLYSLFYRSFVKKLSLEYNLEQVLDSSTCDASRACFISYDPEVYYNPNAEMIDINSHINLENDDSIF